MLIYSFSFWGITLQNDSARKADIMLKPQTSVRGNPKESTVASERRFMI